MKWSAIVLEQKAGDQNSVSDNLFDFMFIIFLSQITVIFCVFQRGTDYNVIHLKGCGTSPKS